MYQIKFFQLLSLSDMSTEIIITMTIKSQSEQKLLQWPKWPMMYNVINAVTTTYESVTKHHKMILRVTQTFCIKPCTLLLL